MSTKLNRIFLKIDGTKYRLPVVPEIIKTSCSSNNSSLAVVDRGEVTARNGRKEYQYSFSSFFPQKAFKGSIAQKNMLAPGKYV